MPGSIISGIFGNEAANTQADAARSAADTSAAAADRAAAIQKQMYDAGLVQQRQIYDQTRADQTPWREAGSNALAKMANFAAPTGFQFSGNDYMDPGYNFRLSEGMKAMDRSAAARGGLISGAALKAGQRYGQEMGSQEYMNAFNRALTGYNANQGAQNTQFNRLASLAGVGQTANNQIGNAGSQFANAASNAGSQYANNTGNLMMQSAGDMGTAQLVGGMGRASAYQGIGNSLSRMMGNNSNSSWNPFSSSSSSPAYYSNYSDPYSWANGGSEG